MRRLAVSSARVVMPVVMPVVMVLAWSGTPAAANGASGRFVDDDSSIHETAIEAVAAAGVTIGCDPPLNANFCPDAPVTRGQMAAFLHRGFDGLPLGDPAPMIDVAASVFADDIAWLAAADITKGCNPPTNDRFCPDSTVTRGEMAAFLVRALGLSDPGTSEFVDDDGVFENDIERLATAGITRGCNPPVNDQFCPERPISRAEMATFLVRALDLEPRVPELDLINGYDCTKDGLVCRATIVSPGGRRVTILEGWDHALPFQTIEQTAFESASFDLHIDGVSQILEPMPDEDVAVARRRWRADMVVPETGSVVVDARWIWQGTEERRTVLTIIAQ